MPETTNFSLSVELLRQHESKIGKPQNRRRWELRNEFRRALKEVLDAVETDLLDRCLSCDDSGWRGGIDPSNCCPCCPAYEAEEPQ